MYRLEQPNHNITLPYKLTESQRKYFGIIMNDSTDTINHKIYGEFLYSLIDHPLGNNSYESILLSSLAVHSILPDLRYKDPEWVTKEYAALLAIFRIVILFLANQFNPNNETFNDAVDSMVRTNFSNEKSTPLAWIMRTFQYAKTIASNTVNRNTVFWEENTLRYNSIILSILEFQSIVTKKIVEAQQILCVLLEIDEYDERPHIKLETIVDNIGNDTNKYSFLEEPANSWMHKKEFSAYITANITANYHRLLSWYTPDTQTLISNQVHRYEEKFKSFRKILMVLVHITGGQPGRGTEINDILHYNTMNKRRNVFIDRGIICFETCYSKTSNQYQSIHQIFRFVPIQVSEMIVYYLWLVLPFYGGLKNGFLNDSSSHQPLSTLVSPHFWGKDFTNRESTSLISTTDLSTYMSAFFSDIGIGKDINVSSYRHISIAIARKFLINKFDEDNSDAEKKETHNVDAQACHSSETANRVYGRSSSDHPETLQIRMDAYRKVSIEWHVLLNLAIIEERNNSTVLKQKEILESTQENRLESLKYKIPSLQQCLQLFMNDIHANFRGNQHQTLVSALKRTPIILQVAGTGVGKSLSFMLPSYMTYYGTTIVIVPLVQLQSDLQRRCQEFNLQCTIWKPSQSILDNKIVLVTPEMANSSNFIDYVNLLVSQCQLDRIVVDECHLYLKSNKQFRSTMSDIKNFLFRTGSQVLFLTATLPIEKEEQFLRLFGISRDDICIYRGSTARNNVQYVVKTTNDFNKYVYDDIKKNINQLDYGKMIIYVRDIPTGTELSRQLSCCFYHSACAGSDDKQRMVDAWRQSQKSYIVATNAMGCGLDIPDVRMVLHIGSPSCISDYVQESGRCGRDGNASTAILYHLKSRKYVMEPCIELYIRTNGCRRLVINKYMDGQPTNCLNTNAIQCDNCIQPATSMVSHTTIQTPGTKRPQTYITPSLTPSISAIKSRRIFVEHGSKALNVERSSTTRKLEQYLSCFNHTCGLCWYENKDACAPMTHNDCSNRDATYKKFNNQVGLGIRQSSHVRTVFSRKEVVFQDNTCCYKCHVPQQMCTNTTWDETTNIFVTGNDQCQYRNVILDIIYISINVSENCRKKYLAELERASIAKENIWVKKDRYPARMVIEYLSRECNFIDYPSTNLCSMFYSLMKELKK